MEEGKREIGRNGKREGVKMRLVGMEEKRKGWEVENKGRGKKG